MIRLIRNDGMEILLNTEGILSVTESGSGTIISLTHGEDLHVKNTRSDILQKVDAFRKGLADELRNASKKNQPGDKDKDKEKEKEKDKGKDKGKDKDKDKGKDKGKDRDKDKEKEKHSRDKEKK